MLCWPRLPWSLERQANQDTLPPECQVPCFCQLFHINGTATTTMPRPSTACKFFKQNIEAGQEEQPGQEMQENEKDSATTASSMLQPHAKQHHYYYTLPGALIFMPWQPGVVRELAWADGLGRLLECALQRNQDLGFLDRLALRHVARFLQSLCPALFAFIRFML